VEREDHGDVTVVSIEFPILADDPATEEVFTTLYTLIESSGRRKFVLDLGAVRYFASAALGKLVALSRKVCAAEVRLVLCNVTPTVERILQVTHLNDLLLSFASEREAREALA
jgi:anti-anti-sigma factor